MLLERIALQRFRHLDGREFAFARGLNLIVGPNEAGKSTLQEAILFALLGNPRHRSLDRAYRVSDRITWGALDASGTPQPFRLTMDLRDDDGAPYRLEKDWCNGSAALINLADGERLDDVDAVQRALGAMLGCDSLRLLASTAWVQQDAIADISAGRRELSDQLQALITGEGVDEVAISGVLQALHSHIAEMERGYRTAAARNPGPIKRAQEELAAVRADLTRASDEVRRVDESRDALAALESEIAAMEEQRATTGALLERCNERVGLARALEAAQQDELRYERHLEQLAAAGESLRRAEEELGPTAALASVDAALEQHMVGLWQRAELLSERAQRLAAQEAAAASAPQSAPVPGGDGRPLRRLLLPLAMILLGFVLLVVGLWTHLDAGVFGAVLVLSGGVWLIARALLAQRTAVAPASPDGTAALRDERAALELQRGEVRSELTSRLAAVGCDNWDAFVDGLSRRREALRTHAAATARHKALLDGAPDDAEALRRTASRRRRDAEERLAEPGMAQAAQVTPLEHEALQRRLAYLEKELARKREEAAYHAGISRGAESDMLERLHRLKEREASVERALSRWHERLAVWHLAHSTLQAARESTLHTAQQELAPRMGRYLERLTRGRYSRVEADPELNLSVYHAERQGWLPVEAGSLSRGTVEQVYWAARLALLDLVCRNGRPPLLLDDPFVKFDPARRQEALALCHELSRSTQVLLFTCHDGMDHLADHVIALGA